MRKNDGDLAGHANELEALLREIYGMAMLCQETPTWMESNEFAHWFLVQMVDQIEQKMPSIHEPGDGIPF